MALLLGRALGHATASQPPGPGAADSTAAGARAAQRLLPARPAG
ncbi:hypothetical protein [Comamonas granuli]|nr:hypothetical protein [Comamonas granuli]